MFTNPFRILCIILIVFGFSVAQIPDKQKVVAGAERALERAAKTNSMPAPGCAVGVSVNGESVFEKAFGLAEMEHNVPNTAQTIFESGSVAKQFTAAALVLLQQEGKLSIDDPVRKYIPELPDYGKPLTIRHMLNHTAGLRDWGSVMELTGAGRGDRVITQDIALDVIAHQKALDFAPGAEYSYSNSGYNLAAIIVERVSKQKFADFLKERIFKPLGMNHSSIRDDYRRLVPGRAQGYSRSGANGPWMLNMPIMNVYGNGGILTTVGDWLKWNAMLDSRSMGAPLVEALETQGVLNDGRKITYALGLVVDSYKGIRQIGHNGATAGYVTALGRYPDQKLSVAVLCNGSAMDPNELLESIVDESLGPFPSSPVQTPTFVKLSEDQLMKFVGTWRNEKTRNPNQIILDNGELKINGGSLKPISEDAFMLGERKAKFISNKDGLASVMEIANTDGSMTRLLFEREWKPTDLNEFAGDWYSEEAQSRISIAIENGSAILNLRPVLHFQLRPVYRDAFSGQGFTLWFTRDPSGKITQLHVGGPRMRDMLFTRALSR